ncbi:P-loop containing nucleoside triphosphate hydrolase protein [Coprinopsis marcescibilis]|uniref:DNA helicase n=1 Tax=Coprinopsis marcescibilis TaxID=230819 RepID=A0A5C3LBS5_COPMA|nr:P-loop containing nucleoside triphosphate hydrolase protein [Coprinopsis marcescibilis]
MSSEGEIKAFIARQRQLLLRERNAEIERSSLLLSNCGPKLLEQKGLALNGLGVASVNIGLGGKTLVELERPSAYHVSPIFPPHTFRNGDIARIEANVSSGSTTKKAKKLATDTTSVTNSAEGVVYKVSDTRIVISIDPSDAGSDALDLPERCRVVKLANSITYDRMDKVIDRLEKTTAPSGDNKVPADWKLTPLMEVLLAMKPLSQRTPIKDSDLTFFDPNLNESQREAIKFCLSSPEVACIHGPPGTGKTHTLVELIRQMTTQSTVTTKPLRLLVCGASNLSVDNVLERLLALPSDKDKPALKVTRIGHPARVMAHQGILDSTLEVKTTRTDQAALVKDVKQELETILGTLSGKVKGAKGKAPRGAERRKMWDEVKALRKEFRQREGGIVTSVLSESQVVLATCHSAGGRQLRNQEFDVVIIDEATQAMEAVCWIPVFKAKKLILAGDPKQLPPTVLSLNQERRMKEKAKAKPLAKGKPEAKQKNIAGKADPEPESSDKDEGGPLDSDRDTEGDTDKELEDDNEEAGNPLSNEPEGPVSTSRIKNARKEPKVELVSPKSLEVTMFERLENMYGSRIKRMLAVQYRMHKQICDFPSKTLYQSKLKSHPSVADHTLQDLVGDLSGDGNNDEEETLQHPVVFFDTSGCEYFERLDGDTDEGSRCNENEATIVKNWVTKLVDVGVEPGQIAIITPYQAQVTLLTSLLRPLYGSSLEIGTVDGMQGREKEAVIITLVRSNDKREVGFLKEKRRMNVAMTRARRHLCVIGDSSTVVHGGRYLKKWLEWLESNADVRFPEV